MLPSWLWKPLIVHRLAAFEFLEQHQLLGDTSRALLTQMFMATGLIKNIIFGGPDNWGNCLGYVISYSQE